MHPSITESTSGFRRARFSFVNDFTHQCSHPCKFCYLTFTSSSMSDELEENTLSLGPGLTPTEWDIIAWMRAHPSESFTVDVEGSICSLNGLNRSPSRTTGTSRTSTARNQYRIGFGSNSPGYDLTHDVERESPVRGQTRYRNGTPSRPFNVVSESRRNSNRADFMGTPLLT
ncbi:hypothetical protein GYMLUDRAFT_61395 [Collybiopsis luxurians FD-317 M1]|uniref:Uncharacterized protein n=1 Tax=Collybiopsis luxurians FD-317 M1 TaxID=944289 RepID=A0A0D0C4S2_9AGAR|nr:hypothetical protein GYMLUDRAFT_61395 [Collybiopsis luxurians FD-317 M1]